MTKSEIKLIKFTAQGSCTYWNESLESRSRRPGLNSNVDEWSYDGVLIGNAVGRCVMGVR
jgi:hypothetical protein